MICERERGVEDDSRSLSVEDDSRVLFLLVGNRENSGMIKRMGE